MFKKKERTSNAPNVPSSSLGTRLVVKHYPGARMAKGNHRHNWVTIHWTTATGTAFIYL